MMSVTLRQYNVKKDFSAACEFLVSHYLPGNSDGNFFRPAWEYMHSHPGTDEKSYPRIGIWEDSGNIVGFVHFESQLGESFFELSPGYEFLRTEMLDYAEEHLCGVTPEGRRYLHAFINDFDKDFEQTAISRGYEKNDKLSRPMTRLDITQPFRPDTSLPAGFTMQSLDDENDLARLDRCVWRGFNHGDEPPEIDYAGRKKMQSVPGFRKDLNIVIVAPDGNYVSYAGTWYEPFNRYAYVEPVCTDPDYRRMGLAKAALFEGIRRCGEMGAETVYVGSLLPLYQSMGFRHLFTCNCWVKNPDRAA